jgi:hypothetical protein
MLRLDNGATTRFVRVGEYDLGWSLTAATGPAFSGQGPGG